MFFHSLTRNTRANSFRWRIIGGILIVSLLSIRFPMPIVLADDANDQTAVVDTVDQSNDAPLAKTASETSAIIETGNAMSEEEIANTVNTNTTDTDSAVVDDDASFIPAEEAVETTPDISSDTIPTEDTASVSSLSDESAETSPESPDNNTVVSNENDAILENTVESSAQTGGNEASGAGISSVTTGNAFAGANIINVINTNVLNSTGLLLLLNNFFNVTDDFDLRNIYFPSTSADPVIENSEGAFEAEDEPCDPDVCAQSSTIASKNINTAQIINDVVVRANTGQNMATSDNATIDTGNAYVGANVVNIANTNIVDSNYLILEINNFDDWFGDFVFPSSGALNGLFGFGNSNAAEQDEDTANISNANDAIVTNNVTTNALTGGNEITGAGDGSDVRTGNAVASANIENIVNQNIFNTDSFLVIFRIHGNWIGNIFGSPNGLAWQETPGGIMLFNGDFSENSANSKKNAVTNVNNDVKNNNLANITNNVNVYALTGDNKVAGANSLINTGNAYAAANIVNVANANIVGKNWVLAIVNIFGNWTGNVAFGKPDLWIGGMVETKKYPVDPGTWMKYRFTVVNRGDADATDVSVIDTLDLRHLKYRKPANAELRGDTIVWHIGTIVPGGTVELELDAQVTSGNIPNGTMTIDNTVTATSAENDQNNADNREMVIFDVYKPSAISWTDVILTPDPHLFVVKTNNTTGPITASSTVDYTITIKNKGGSAYHSVVVDTLKNEKGDVINEEVWDLGEIVPNEEITVDYSIFFTASTTPGGYTNTAQVHAIGRNASLDPFYGWFADSEVTTSTITILGNPPMTFFGETPWSNATSVVMENATPPTRSIIAQNTILTKNINSTYALLEKPFRGIQVMKGDSATIEDGGNDEISVTEFDPSEVCSLEKPDPRPNSFADLMLALGLGDLAKGDGGGTNGAFVYLALTYLILYLLYSTYREEAHRRLFYDLDSPQGIAALFANGTTLAYIIASITGITEALTPLVMINIMLISTVFFFNYHDELSRYFSRMAAFVRFTSFL